MHKLVSLLPQHGKSAGFAPYGCIEMVLLAYVVAAVLNLALGNWIFATAMLHRWPGFSSGQCTQPGGAAEE